MHCDTAFARKRRPAAFTSRLGISAHSVRRRRCAQNKTDVTLDAANAYLASTTPCVVSRASTVAAVLDSSTGLLRKHHLHLMSAHRSTNPHATAGAERWWVLER
jgi:hypothetical protein